MDGFQQSSRNPGVRGRRVPVGGSGIKNRRGWWRNEECRERRKGQHIVDQRHKNDTLISSQFRNKEYISIILFSPSISISNLILHNVDVVCSSACTGHEISRLSRDAFNLSRLSSSFPPPRHSQSSIQHGSSRIFLERCTQRRQGLHSRRCCRL